MIATMGRQATGSVEERSTRDGDVMFSIRVTDPKGGRDGRPKRPRITLGSLSEGWTRSRADDKLVDTVAALRMGVDLYVLFPPVVKPEEDPDREPSLAELGEKYVKDAETRGLEQKTVEGRRWINGHAMPHIGHLTVSELSGSVVDELRERLVTHRDMVRARAQTPHPVMEERSRADGVTWEQKARPLSDRSINRVLGGVSALVDWAMVTQENVTERHNPAASKHRRLIVPTVDSRSYYEPDQVVVFLEAARIYEHEAREKVGRRAAAAEVEVAVLAMGALRISELSYAERTRVNVGAGFMIAGRKTAAGRDRKIMLVFDVLTDLLASHLAAHSGGRWLFEAHGGKGQRRAPDNVRRMLYDIWEIANALAVERGIAELEEATPHVFRRTNISLLCAAGYPPGWTARQVGHRDRKLTLQIYDQVMHAQQADENRERANALLGARKIATTDHVTAPDVVPDEWTRDHEHARG